MERRKFLGGAAAGVVAGAATTVGGGESQAQTKSDATKPDADSLYHSHEGGSPAIRCCPRIPRCALRRWRPCCSRRVSSMPRPSTR